MTNRQTRQQLCLAKKEEEEKKTKPESGVDAVGGWCGAADVAGGRVGRWAGLGGHWVRAKATAVVKYLELCFEKNVEGSVEVLSTNPAGYSASSANVVCVCCYICVCVYIYTYMYIFIEREGEGGVRERERERHMYIYTHTIFVYPWVHINAAFPPRQRCRYLRQTFLLFWSANKCQSSIFDSVVWRRRPNVSTDSRTPLLPLHSRSCDMRTRRNTSQVYKGSVCKSDYFEIQPLNRS